MREERGSECVCEREREGEGERGRAKKVSRQMTTSKLAIRAIKLKMEQTQASSYFVCSSP